MNYNELQDNKQRILIGNVTVYLILAVSFAATIAYWVVLAGLENSDELQSGWKVLLYLIVGVGAVAEIIKKVTLSTYRSPSIWFAATAISVVTVMGTYAILDSTRQEQITRSSDAYQDGRAMKQAGLADAAKYAHAAGYDLGALQSKLEDIVCQRAADCGGGRKISYANYLSQKTEVEQQIADAKGYQRAMGTAQIGTTSMEAGGSSQTSSNPLLSDAATISGISEKALKTVFYLSVTLLLEFAAFFIGGKVRELIIEQRYTESELQERKNKVMFGVTIAELMGHTPAALPTQQRREPQQNSQSDAGNDHTPEPKKSGWSVTPAVGAGIGIGSDGIGGGIGAGVVATPKAEAPATNKVEPTPEAKPEPRPEPKPSQPAEQQSPAQQPKRMEGFGFRGKILPADDQAKAISSLNAQAKHAQAPTDQDTQPRAKRGTAEALTNTQEKPSVLSARTQKHTENTQNTRRTHRSQTRKKHPQPTPCTKRG